MIRSRSLPGIWLAALVILLTMTLATGFSSTASPFPGASVPPWPVANTPPYANYSYSPAGGNTTTLVSFWAKVFDQEDPVTALEVHWDWESDGTWDTPWSTEKNATHTFDSPGTYWVLLEARDTGGLTGNQSYPITVTNPPPPPPPTLEASISATPMEGTLPVTVAFSSAVSGGTPPYEYHWTLGDGAQSPDANPVHIYLTSGNFTVWLIVYDSGGVDFHQDTLSNALYVNVSRALVNLSVVPIVEPVAAVGPGTLQFSSTVSGGSPPYAYRWDFGDGMTSAEASPTHAYASAGTYLITLIVTDSGGHATTTRFSATVPGGGSTAPWTWIGLGVLGGAVAGAVIVLAAQRIRKRPPAP